jgi:hypothetical protein
VGKVFEVVLLDSDVTTLKANSDKEANSWVNALRNLKQLYVDAGSPPDDKAEEDESNDAPAEDAEEDEADESIMTHPAPNDDLHESWLRAEQEELALLNKKREEMLLVVASAVPAQVKATPAPVPETENAAPAPAPEPENAAPAPTPEPENAAPASVPEPEPIQAAPAPAPEPENAAPAPAPEPENAAPASVREPEPVQVAPAPVPEPEHAAPEPEPVKSVSEEVPQQSAVISETRGPVPVPPISSVENTESASAPPASSPTKDTSVPARVSLPPAAPAPGSGGGGGGMVDIDFERRPSDLLRVLPARKDLSSKPNPEDAKRKEVPEHLKPAAGEVNALTNKPLRTAPVGQERRVARRRSVTSRRCRAFDMTGGECTSFHFRDSPFCHDHAHLDPASVNNNNNNPLLLLLFFFFFSLDMY